MHSDLFHYLLGSTSIQYLALFDEMLMIVAPPPPKTMTREWQEATNARLKELGIEPISGPGSEDYKVI